MNPYGFELQTTEPVLRRARPQCGSGIAERSTIWARVQLPDAAPISMDLNTEPRLTRVVLEFMAGHPPAPLPEYTMPYAKRMSHPHTGASRFVWHRRVRKSSKFRVSLIPFGVALL